MIIGCVKELLNQEFRVGLTPENAQIYIAHGHLVFIEKGAGIMAGFSDELYIKVGATILETAKEVYDIADMIVKVKEPLPQEYNLLRPKQILFTFLHLAANPELTKVLLDKKISAIAYETIREEDGSLPCLKPMSEIAGKIAINEGIKYLQVHYGGRGVFLGQVSGINNGTILIIGAGNAGSSALQSAVLLGCRVIIIDRNIGRLCQIKKEYPSVITLELNATNLEKSISQSDLIVCAILVPGGKTPKLITKKDLSFFLKGSVVVDISIDQGGCLETSKRTTYENPIYCVDGVVHYCVGNMPGAFPNTSTVALTRATIKYGLLIANGGISEVLQNKILRTGLNIHDGLIFNELLKL